MGNLILVTRVGKRTPKLFDLTNLSMRERSRWMKHYGHLEASDVDVRSLIHLGNLRTHVNSASPGAAVGESRLDSKRAFDLSNR